MKQKIVIEVDVSGPGGEYCRPVCPYYMAEYCMIGGEDLMRDGTGMVRRSERCLGGQKK